ncbi:MAG: NUDIX hydrolase [Firmicutes bacterium]|nr:NUDIX hydrolase [Bacillota bacterium]
MVFEEKTLSEEMIYEGKIINLKKQKVTVKNGTSYREIIEHNGGAVLAAITDDKKMVMIRQFRKPAEKVMFEVPAGKIDPGEDPLVTAGRELKEETGYTAREVKYLTSFYPSVGYSKEVLHLYLCTGLVPGETDFDENEAIDMELWDIEELYQMVMRGELDDAKTIIAIQFAHELIK